MRNHLHRQRVTTLPRESSELFALTLRLFSVNQVRIFTRLNRAGEDAATAAHLRCLGNVPTAQCCCFQQYQ